MRKVVKNSQIICATLFTSGVLGALLYAWSYHDSGVGDTASTPLFLLAGDSPAIEGDFSESGISKRHKFIEVSASAMDAFANGADRMQLQLFDGKEYTMVFTDHNDGPVASTATGELVEVPGSKVILSTAASEDGLRKISGKFSMPDGRVLQITPTANGHCLFELDQDGIRVLCELPSADLPIDTYKANGETIQVLQQAVSRRSLRGNRPGGTNSFSGSGSSPRRSLRGSRPASVASNIITNLDFSSGVSLSPGVGSSLDDSVSISLLGVYTEQASKGKGGDAGIKAHIAAAVAEVNSALKSSEVGASIKLAGTLRTTYNSKGDLSAALKWLRSDSAVKSSRNSNKADLVTFFIFSDIKKGNVGLGSLLPTVKGNSGAAFTVVIEKFALVQHSFAHEIGHNLGGNHCWDQYGKGATDYAQGHRWKGLDGKGYRSIMSYAKNGDKKVGVFSNPKVSFKGKPTGDATKADNGRAFKITAKAVSKYK